MLRVKRTFHAFTSDGVRTFAVGSLVNDDDSAVKGRENLFETVADESSKAKPAAKSRRPTANKARQKLADK